jgi:hypothetical protein
MKEAQDVLPWRVTDISTRPYEGFWSFNPSIHFDGQTWRVVLRCCDYAMPDGKTIRSKTARSSGQQTKNAMVILDPSMWKPIQIFKMRENDKRLREPCPHVGFEDMRLFRTDKGGLQGIAASLHLRRDREPRRAADFRPVSQPPEQVVLSFDENYDIVDAHPIRGDGWSGTPQKNWVPFDNCAEPRFLYAINKGRMFGLQGDLHGEGALAVPSSNLTTSSTTPVSSASIAVEAVYQEPEKRRDPNDVRPNRPRLAHGSRMKLDASSTRVAPRPSSRVDRSSGRTAPMYRGGDDAMRIMGAGRGALSYKGLRGGTQLIRVADDVWLGIGHEMKFNPLKYYWHTMYTVNSRGKMLAVSDPIKLAPEGIEFAAGMAIDGDRVVVSFGVDDMNCRLGETSLSAVMGLLKPLIP